MDQDPGQLPNRRRIALLAAGWTFVALGAVGALLPVLPTTCFMIAALACFTRASPRLAAWLLHHPRFGPPLRAWKEHRAISRKSKVLACAGMTVAFAVVVVVSGGWLVPGAVGVTLAAVAAFVVTRPPPPAADRDGMRMESAPPTTA